MGRVMFEERTYERKEIIEIRAARGGDVQRWFKARIDAVTSKGAHVTVQGTGRTTHIGFKDMRHLGTPDVVEEKKPESVAAPAKSTFSNPVLSTETADKFKHNSAQSVVKPVATVTPIRPTTIEAPEAVVENAQKLVNVSKLRKTTPPKTAPNQLLAGLLKNARELEMLSQKDVADLIGTNQMTVCRYERAEQVPDDDVLLEYSVRLGMDLDLLLLARDRPEEATTYKPKPKAPPPPAPVPHTPMEDTKPKEVPLPISAPAVKTLVTVTTPTSSLAMEDFFEFCDKMELICPQPSDPALRKQWRALAKGMFELRSKL